MGHSSVDKVIRLMIWRSVCSYCCEKHHLKYFIPTDALYGSLESLSTAVSLSSHADRCLLKSYGSLDNLRLYDEANCGTTKKQNSRDYQLLEGSSSEREEQTASGEEQTEANGDENATRRESENEDRGCKESAVQAVLDKVGRSKPRLFYRRKWCEFVFSTHGDKWLLHQ